MISIELNGEITVPVKKNVMTDGYYDDKETIVVKVMNIRSSESNSIEVTMKWHKPFCVIPMIRTIELDSLATSVVQDLLNKLNDVPEKHIWFIVGYYFGTRGISLTLPDKS